MVDQGAYEVAVRAMLHHRRRAADALALLEDLITAAAERGIDVEAWQTRAAEIRERPRSTGAAVLVEILQALTEDAQSDRPRPEPVVEYDDLGRPAAVSWPKRSVHGDPDDHTDIEEGPVRAVEPEDELDAGAEPGEPASVHRLLTVYGGRRDEPPPATVAVESAREVDGLDVAIAWAHRAWRDVEMVEAPRPQASTVLVAYRLQGREVRQRLALNRLRLPTNH